MWENDKIYYFFEEIDKIYSCLQFLHHLVRLCWPSLAHMLQWVGTQHDKNSTHSNQGYYSLFHHLMIIYWHVSLECWHVPCKKKSRNIDGVSWQDHGSPHVIIFSVVAVEIKGTFSACMFQYGSIWSPLSWNFTWANLAGPLIF